MQPSRILEVYIENLYDRVVLHTRLFADMVAYRRNATLIFREGDMSGHNQRARAIEYEPRLAKYEDWWNFASIETLKAISRFFSATLAYDIFEVDKRGWNERADRMCEGMAKLGVFLDDFDPEKYHISETSPDEFVRDEITYGYAEPETVGYNGV